MTAGTIQNSYLSILMMLVLLLGVQLLPADVQSLWLYERQEILNGQWWRLLSAHWVHLSWQHLLVNAGGLVLWVGLFPRLPSRQLWLMVLLLSLAVSGSLLIWNNNVAWYGGFSGILMGLYMAAAILTFPEERLINRLIIAIIGGKVALEQLAGWGLAVVDVPVIVDAHLYGVLAALVCVLGFKLYPSTVSEAL